MRSECNNCGNLSDYDDGVWHPGEVCLFGILYMCSEKCALEYVENNPPPPEYGFDPARDMDVEPEHT